MSDWMITIDTPPDVSHDQETLLAFADALDETLGSTGASASMSVETGVVSATFTVTVESVQEAVDSAVAAFNAAFNQVGLDGNIVHVDAELVGDCELALA